MSPADHPPAAADRRGLTPSSHDRMTEMTSAWHVHGAGRQMSGARTQVMFHNMDGVMRSADTPSLSYLAAAPHCTGFWSRVGLLPLEDPLVPEAYLCTVLFEYTSAAGRWLGLQVHVQYTWPQRAPWKEAAGSGSLENVPRQAVLRAYVCTYGGLGGGVAPVSRM